MHRMRYRIFASWFSIGILCLPGLVRGNSDTHYQDVIIGERAAGMGGAFTALANEAAGAYYNPAGIIAEGSTLLQLSMSAYKLRRMEVEVANLCGTTLKDDQSAFFGFPGSFGFAKQFRTADVFHGLALTLAVPHSDKVSQAFVQKNAQCGPLALGVAGSQFMVDRTILTGFSYAIKPWRFLQAGMTLGLNIRTVSFNSVVATVPEVQGYTFYPAGEFRNGEVNLWNLFLQLGLITEPIEGLRFGLSLSTPYLRLSGTGHFDFIAGEADPNAWENTHGQALDDVEYNWKVPFQLGLGAAYTMKGRYALAVDVKLHGAVDRYAILEHPQLDPALAADFFNQRDTVINFNLGGELFLTSRWALRFGFFTNFSSLPQDMQEGDLERVNLYGLTLGGSFFSSPSSVLSFAAQAQIGQGQRTAYRVRYENEEFQSSNDLVDTQDFSLIVSIGGSFDIQ